MAEIKVIYSGPIIKKWEAFEKGLLKYFTGESCHNGHIDQRYTGTKRSGGGGCISCARIKTSAARKLNPQKFRAYSRNWQKNNPDKVREAKRQSYNRNAQIHKSSQAYDYTDIQFFYTGPLVSLAQAKELKIKKYFTGKPCPQKHVDQRYVSGGCIRCQYNNSWRHDPKKKILAVVKWKKKNPEKVRNIDRRHRALKNGADGFHTFNEIDALGGKQKWKCLNCKKSIKKSYCCDHIMPLARGGSNNIKNIQLLCNKCNCQKHAKDPIKWAQENGRLL